METDELTATQIILQETIQNPLVRAQRVLMLREGFCLFELMVRDEEILLNNITVPPEDRGKGYATEGIEWLKSVSERTRNQIIGIIEPNGRGGLDSKQLAEWYRKCGFTVTKNRIVYYPNSLY